MRIYVKRMDTGKTTTLYVDPFDTIGTVKGQIRAKQGIPPKHQRLNFGWVVLEDVRTITDYNIQPDTSLMLLIAGVGGGKRARDGDDNADSMNNRIPEVIGELHVQPTDSQAAKKSLGEVVDIDAWIKDLSLKDAEMLKELTIKHETRGNNDFVLLQYAQYLPAIGAVEVRAIVFRIARTCVFVHANLCVLSRTLVCFFTQTCVFVHAHVCVCSRTLV